MPARDAAFEKKKGTEKKLFLLYYLCENVNAHLSSLHAKYESTTPGQANLL
jgi:hypothetical protein